MGKSLLSELTHRSYSKTKNPDGTRTPQLRIGIEAKLPYHSFLSDWGDKYQSIMRTALNALQNGQSEDDIEKSFQRRKLRQPGSIGKSLCLLNLRLQVFIEIFVPGMAVFGPIIIISLLSWNKDVKVSYQS